jgi:hypothetical protein
MEEIKQIKKQSITKQAREKFDTWRKRRTGREYLAVLFVENRGRCPRCGQLMVLSYEDKHFDNRATFNHVIPLVDSVDDPKNPENLDILCWMCNHMDGIETFNRTSATKVDELPQLPEMEK